MREKRIKEATTVLAVTEDQALVATIRKGLISGSRDFTTATVRNALEAYQALQVRRFHCMLLDLAVPQFHWDDLLLTMELDGIETPAIVLAEGWQDTTMIRRFSNVVDCFQRRMELQRIVESILRHLGVHV